MVPAAPQLRVRRGSSHGYRFFTRLHGFRGLCLLNNPHPFFGPRRDDRHQCSQRSKLCWSPSIPGQDVRPRQARQRNRPVEWNTGLLCQCGNGTRRLCWPRRSGSRAVCCQWRPSGEIDRVQVVQIDQRKARVLEVARRNNVWHAHVRSPRDAVESAPASPSARHAGDESGAGARSRQEEGAGQDTGDGVCGR